MERSVLKICRHLIGVCRYVHVHNYVFGLNTMVMWNRRSVNNLILHSVHIENCLLGLHLLWRCIEIYAYVTRLTNANFNWLHHLPLALSDNRFLYSIYSRICTWFVGVGFFCFIEPRTSRFVYNLFIIYLPILYKVISWHRGNITNLPCSTEVVQSSLLTHTFHHTYEIRHGLSTIIMPSTNKSQPTHITHLFSHILVHISGLSCFVLSYHECPNWVYRLDTVICLRVQIIYAFLRTWYTDICCIWVCVGVCSITWRRRMAIIQLVINSIVWFW